MTATNINFGIGSELEARAQSVLAGFGLDVPTAFNIFLMHVVDSGTLPDGFEEPLDYANVLEKKPKRTREEVFGCARGRFNIPDDFNDPLEDFREYME